MGATGSQTSLSVPGSRTLSHVTDGSQLFAGVPSSQAEHSEGSAASEAARTVTCQWAQAGAVTRPSRRSEER
eukprot:182926-Rhodomonas_salina.1